MGLVSKTEDIFEYRLGFDTSSQGIYLFAFQIEGKSYCCGAIYKDCVNPGLLKRQIMMLRSELEEMKISEDETTAKRSEFLFKDITDEEMDGLFTIGGN